MGAVSFDEGYLLQGMQRPLQAHQGRVEDV